MIKIISNGTGIGTHVFNENGERINGIVSITFGEIRVGSALTAKLEFSVSDLDIIAKEAGEDVD